MKPKMNLLIAMAAMAAAAGSHFLQGARTLRSMGLGDSASAVLSSRNGGRRVGVGNRHSLRAAVKKRNQARNRRAHRGA